jgi:HlyD family secretion protein
MANFLVPVKNKISALINGPGEVDSDSPEREAILGQRIAIGFFVIVLGGAALIPVDAAVYARGNVVVANSRQHIQNKTGGVVSKILVREGAIVKKGQTLIELAGDESEASAESLAGQFISLKAQEARLLAEQLGASTFAEPIEFKTYSGDMRRMANDAMRLQRQTLITRRQSLSAQLSVLNQQANQAREQIIGTQRRIAANANQQALVNDELQGVKDLNAQGFAPKTRVRNLESTIAGLDGENGALRANVAQTNAAINESQMRGISLQKQQSENAVAELRDTQLRLSNIAPQLDAANTEFDRTSLKAPVSGKVMGLNVSTIGGVIAPGEKIMDIVPVDAPLVIEALILPQDGDDIRAGLICQIRFSSLHERNLPELTGKVLDVSADSFVDQKSGQSFYKARIEVSANSLVAITEQRGRDVIKPGLPVEVVVPLRKRSLLTYIVEPLVSTFWRSFREH